MESGYHGGSMKDKYLIFRYIILIVTVGAVSAYLCRSFGILSAVCLLSCISMTLIFFIYKIKTDRQIRRITESVERIARMEYDINLDDMAEGEFSILQTSVYKTAVHLKEQAENARKDKESVKNALSDISHQLKTPLTAIAILVENMLDDPKMDPAVREDFLKEIHHSITHINGLVQSLLKLSRFEANAVEFHRKKCRAGRILDAAAENVAVLCDLKDVELTMEGDKDAEIVCDAYWQTEAITNILKNCIEHMRVSPDSKEEQNNSAVTMSSSGNFDPDQSAEPGKSQPEKTCVEPFDNEAGEHVNQEPMRNRIMVTVTHTSVYTKIVITDNGQGISDEEIAHVFERFYRGKNAAPDSAGIGLALTKSIVEVDGGEIRVDSDGEGTRFEIMYFTEFSDKKQ